MPAGTRSARKLLLAAALAGAAMVAGPAVAQGALAGPSGQARSGRAVPDHLRLALWQGELGRLPSVPWRLQTGAFVDLRPGAAATPPEATLYLSLDGGERRWQLFVRRSVALYAADVSAGIRFQASF